MKNLYVIGNGFDLYHRLNTRYQTFATYLAEKNRHIYDLLCTYYGLPDIVYSKTTDHEYGLWSKFEEVLADLDYQGVLEDNSDLIARPASDDFRDRDWHSYQIEMKMIVEDLTDNLKSEFNKFILDIDYNKDIEDINDICINFEKDSLFLNFNYTETLQKYYNINPTLIKYIHNKAESNNVKIILGHGTNPENFKEPEDSPPDGLTDEELEEWKEHKADEYDYSYESAKQEILGYYFSSFKNTHSIISENEDFFDLLKSIERVYILGHSVSPVDIEYFKKLKNSLSDNVEWFVSYYSETEKEKHITNLLGLKIFKDKIKQIRIEDLRASLMQQYKLEL